MSDQKRAWGTSPRTELGLASQHAARSLALIAFLVVAGLLGNSLFVLAHYSLRTLADATEKHFSAWENAIDNCFYLGEQNPDTPLPAQVLRDTVASLSASENIIASTENDVRLALNSVGVRLAFLLSTSPEETHAINSADVPTDVKDYLHSLTTVPLEILPAIVSGLDVLTAIKIQSRKALAPLTARRDALQQALSKSISIVWPMIIAMSSAILIGIYVTWVMLLKPPLSQLDDAISHVRRSEQQLQTTLDAISDAVIVTDSDLNIISMNPGAQALTGWPIDVAKNLPLANVLELEIQHPESSTTKAVDVTRLAIPGYTPAGVYVLTARNGAKYQVTESVAPLKIDEHGSYGVVIVLRDVTRQLELQRKVDRRVKLQAIGELASGVAHDFANILGTIIGTSSLAIRQDESKNVKSSFEVILRAARNGASLTETLLAFARSSPSMPTVQPIRGILQRAATKANDMYGSKHPISIICDSTLEAEVDSERLLTALMNLIMAAVESAPGNRQILLLAYDEHRNGVNSLTICVEDDGYLALAEPVSSHVEAFFPKRTVTMSRGLGLPMAAAFAEQAGGELYIVSHKKQHRTAVFMHFPIGARLPMAA